MKLLLSAEKVFTVLSLLALTGAWFPRLYEIATGESLIVLSETAMKSLRHDQVQLLQAYGKLIPVSVPTIEQVEGGSVRCMMAEVFLQRKS